MKKVFVVGSDRSTSALFLTWGWDVVHSVDEAQLVCFTGGADVAPDLYDAKQHQYTRTDSNRDAYEIGIFQAAFAKKLPMVGICRGGQFLNVMNGGEMYQEVSGHGMSHAMEIVAGPWMDLNIWATSTHHQMMKPTSEGKILAYGPQSVTIHWDKEEDQWSVNTLSRGIEVVKYGDHLCFQPHPEFMVGDKRFDPLRQYFFILVNSLFKEEKE